MLVYQREPHARRMAFETVPQPTTYEERLAIAERTRDEFDLRCTIVVDGMDDRSRAFFGDQPNSLFVVGPDSVIRLKQPWADPDELGEFLPGFLEMARVKLETAAGAVDASLRSRVALELLDSEPAGRASLLERWAGHTEHLRGSAEPWRYQRLQFALRLVDYQPEAATLGRMLARGRGAFGLIAFRTEDDTESPIDRRLALGAMLVPVLEQSEGEVRSTLIELMRELLPSNGRAQQWLQTFESGEEEPDSEGN